MLPNVARYQNVQIGTSSPGELLVALYDGLFRFLAVAKHGLQNKKYGQAADAISKAYAIVSEFYLTLDHQQHPDLCRNLAQLYDFSMSRLTHANLKRDVRGIEDVIRVLGPIREAFTIAVKEAAAKPAEGAAGPGRAAGR